MHYKSSIRQRRVMLDLIYVNVIAIAFDILIVILVYLNQLGLSHPIQTFSYILKLKLEFLVLNQLMAVAARGLQKSSWEERRYHHASLADTFSAEARHWNGKPARRFGPSSTHDGLLRDQELSEKKMDSLTGLKSANADDLQTHHPREIEDLEELDFGSSPELKIGQFDEEDLLATPPPAAPHHGSSSTKQSATKQSGRTFSGDTLGESDDAPREASPHLYSPMAAGDHHGKLHSSLRPLRHPFSNLKEQQSQYDHQRRRQSEQHQRWRYEREQRKIARAHEKNEQTQLERRKFRNPYRKRPSDIQDDEDEIAIHMWERKGAIEDLDAPWFKSKVEEHDV